MVPHFSDSWLIAYTGATFLS